MRLIDADEIKYEVREKLGLGIDYGINESDVSYVAYKHQIDSMPTAEKIGKWIYHESDNTFECSACGEKMKSNIFNYCPWCGARMMEGEEDE